MNHGHYSFRAAHEEPDSDRDDRLAAARALLAARAPQPDAVLADGRVLDLKTTPAPRKPRRVGSYADAIEWIALNDDTDWLRDRDADREGGQESVTLCLVADVFGRDLEQAVKDLRRAMKRLEVY